MWWRSRWGQRLSGYTRMAPRSSSCRPAGRPRADAADRSRSAAAVCGGPNPLSPMVALLGRAATPTSRDPSPGAHPACSRPIGRVALIRSSPEHGSDVAASQRFKLAGAGRALAARTCLQQRPAHAAFVPQLRSCTPGATRGTVAPMPSPYNAARVAVDDETWQAFRQAALARGIPVSPRLHQAWRRAPRRKRMQRPCRRAGRAPERRRYLRYQRLRDRPSEPRPRRGRPPRQHRARPSTCRGVASRRRQRDAPRPQGQQCNERLRHEGKERTGWDMV